MINKKTTLISRCFAPIFLRRLILSWLLAVAVEYFLLPEALRELGDLEGLARMSLLRVLLLSCGFTAALYGLSLWKPYSAWERWAMVAAVGAIAVMALHASFSWAFLAACLLVFCLAVIFALGGWDCRGEAVPSFRHTSPLWLWITAALTLLFFLFVSIWTVSRVYSFSVPTYDMGIFSQMFYSMRQTGFPMTTVERDGALSHFAVHVSPIYYLLLPIYWLFPYPATLQVLQAAVIATAVIPLWKIGKCHGLSGAQRTLLCAVLLFYPAFSGGTGYDIHENCFLTPLLLWLFYGIDRKKLWLTAVAALLTLLVKEDAAVYVAVIALWLIVKTLLRFRKTDMRDLTTGIVILVVSLGWFFLVTEFLAQSGDGVMTWRYRNFMYDGSASLLTVIKSVILNPLKAVYECMDKEKLYYIAMTFLPLLGLPLLTRRYERYILLIPYILVNLMPDYQYQHDIFFQYSFGSTAFLVYMTVINLADLKVSWQRVFALLVSAIVSAVCFVFIVVPKASRYPVRAIRYYSFYQDIRDTLDTIPEDASVSATTFYTTYLSQRNILYDVRYASQNHLLETEYVVLDPSADSDYTKYAREDSDNGFAALVKLLEDNGYICSASVGDALVIYCLPQSCDP